MTNTFSTFFSLIPEDYDKEFYKAHLQALYRGLLIHLDDPNQVCFITLKLAKSLLYVLVSMLAYV